MLRVIKSELYKTRHRLYPYISSALSWLSASQV